MVIFQRTHGFKGWEARVVWGDTSFGQVEPTEEGGWQVRLFRGLTDLAPVKVGSLAQGQRFLMRFGQSRLHRLAFKNTKDLRMRGQLNLVPLTVDPEIKYKKKRAKHLPN